MLTIEEIGRFIDNDKSSEKKQNARKGLKYYEGEHDIKDYKMYYVDADGKLQEDKLRSNIKIPHPFFTELVDQQVQYMLSGDTPFMRSDDEKLQEKDKYAYFLGGNYGQVHIQNQKAASKAKGKNILIIKDSFANSFVPFVTQDYENIYMVDLRYYNGDMKSYLQEHNITDVLVLYNISNFISDRNLHKLTGGI